MGEGGCKSILPDIAFYTKSNRRCKNQEMLPSVFPPLQSWTLISVNSEF